MMTILYSCFQGDLDNALLIGEYSKTYEIKSIDELLSVSMNVHDSGDILELVGMCCELSYNSSKNLLFI